MTAVISATDLTKRYGSTLALDHATFDIQPGRIVGLLGANGAGKTTALQAILGLIPVKGAIRVMGQSPAHHRHQLMRAICFIADVAILPPWLRVREAIAFVSGVHPKFNRARCEAFLARTHVSLDAKIKTLSKGMIVQVHLALILAIEAKVLLLDEPTLGLDVLYRKAFYRTLMEDYCDDQRTLVISTHQIEEIEGLLTDVIMLRAGRVVLDSSMEQLASRYRQLVVSDASHLPAARALDPLEERTLFGQHGFIYDGVPEDRLRDLGAVAPVPLSDLFVALMKGESA